MSSTGDDEYAGYSAIQNTNFKPPLKEKYGIWLAVAVFGGFIILSAFIAAGVFGCSKAQEDARKKKREGE